MSAVWAAVVVGVVWAVIRYAQARRVVSKDMTDYLLSVDDIDAERWRWGR